MTGAPGSSAADLSLVLPYRVLPGLHLETAAWSSGLHNESWQSTEVVSKLRSGSGREYLYNTAVDLQKGGRPELSWAGSEEAKVW